MPRKPTGRPSGRPKIKTKAPTDPNASPSQWNGTVPEKEIVDPTGVGDGFSGGFLAGYARGFDWKLCGEIGSLSAVYCLEQQGTQNHSYTVQEFVQRFRNHFDDGGRLDALLK